MLAPMPSASTTSATSVKVGAWRSDRMRVRDVVVEREADARQRGPVFGHEPGKGIAEDADGSVREGERAAGGGAIEIAADGIEQLAAEAGAETRGIERDDQTDGAPSSRPDHRPLGASAGRTASSTRSSRRSAAARARRPAAVMWK